MLSPLNVTRRNFLRISALATGGLLVNIAFPVRAKSGGVSLSSFNPFLKIASDNSIHIILSKVEMGQGIWTTLPMLIAEELDCDWKKINVEHSPPGNENDFVEPPILRSTGGSETTKSEFDRYRLAGATTRQMLINVAAKRLGVDPNTCKSENGYVIVLDKKISYGDLATEAASLPIPEIKLRTSSEWKYIGKSQPRLDAPDKVNGKTVYGIDVKFPGLLTAVVAHAPVFGGQVKSFDATKTLSVSGVKEVVQIPTGIAVIADNFWSAKQGKEALVIEWDNGANQNISSQKIIAEYSKISASKGTVVVEKGDVVSSLGKTENILEAEFSFPFLAHAPMEPLNCTVRISENKCEVWAGTQSPLLHQQEIATFLGLKPESVALYTPQLGGSFGRRGTFGGDWMMEAVHIAKASGKFIKLVWTREDDIQGGYYRPVYLHRAKIAIGKEGYPNGWEHHIVGQSLFTGSPLEQWIVQNGIDYSSVTTGAPYTDLVPDISFQLHTTKLGIPVSSWRSVGNTHTAFVIESLIDELASRASIDPVTYRRSFFKNSPRHLAALNLAAEKAGWTTPLPRGKFRGVAVCEAMGSYVAQVVELSIVDKKIRVHRVVCAIDCGLAVNPDGVRAQMEGGIIFGLTAALYGEITIENGQPKESNFHNYKMLRLQESPDIEVHIVASQEKMGGAGEPGVAPISAAVANAVFAATGKRIRSLPISLA